MQLDTGRPAAVAQAVPQHVFHDARQRFAIGKHFHGLVGRHLGRPAALDERGVQLGQALPQHVRHIHRLTSQRPIVAYGLGVLEELIHQHPHDAEPFGGRRHALIALLVAFRHGVQLQVALGTGQGRAHIMGERRQVPLQLATLLSRFKASSISLVDEPVGLLGQGPRRPRGKPQPHPPQIAPAHRQRVGQHPHLPLRSRHIPRQGHRQQKAEHSQPDHRALLFNLTISIRAVYVA